ncbi:MAG: hypothetical protein K2L07_04370 [Lachnospiraceae bacterium]|nr:hypothetical protein [Lachnospiraceae bacterium]
MLDNVMYPNALCAVVIEEHLWFMNHVANALMKMRLSDGIITEWHQIEPYDLLAPTLFLDMVHYRDWLILIPDVCGKHIVYFNLRTKDQECISISDDWFITKKLVLNNRMLLFSKVPTEQMRIAELDIESHKLQRNEGLEQLIDGLIPKDIDRNNHSLDITYGSDKLWMLITGTKYLLEVDLRSRDGKVHIIGDGIYGRLTYSDQGMYISDNKDCLIYRWDANGGINETIEFGECWESANPEDKYGYLLCYDNKIICVSRFSPRVDIYDLALKTKSTLCVDTDQNEFPLSERATLPFYQFRCVVVDNYMVVPANAGRDFFSMNLESKEVAEIRPIIPKSFYEKAIKETNIPVLYEQNLSLNRYIDYILGIGN